MNLKKKVMQVVENIKKMEQNSAGEINFSLKMFSCNCAISLAPHTLLFSVSAKDSFLPSQTFCPRALSLARAARPSSFYSQRDSVNLTESLRHFYIASIVAFDQNIR